MNGLTLAELEAWRALIAAGELAIAEPTITAVRRLGARADEARRTPIPEPRDEARMRLFSKLIGAAAGYGPNRADELRGLIAQCAPIIEAEAATREKALDR